MKFLAYFQLLSLFLIFEKRFWRIRFFMSVWQVLRLFWQISGHWHISRHYFWTSNDKFSLETLHENLEFFVLLFHACRFAVSGYSSSKTKSFEKFINGVSFIPFMYKICKYCLSKAQLGVLMVSLCIYRVLGVFRCYLAFSKD